MLFMEDEYHFASKREKLGEDDLKMDTGRVVSEWGDGHNAKSANAVDVLYCF